MQSVAVNAKPVFHISPHLLSAEREAEYLSKLGIDFGYKIMKDKDCSLPTISF